MKRFLLILLLSVQCIWSQNQLTHEVYFDTDKFIVPDTEQSRLLLFISQLQNYNVDKIAIYGFCDDRGTENYNLVLSQNRADAIKTIFTYKGIDESIISNVDGKGEILLKIIPATDVDIIRGLNRKVEIIADVSKKTEVVETTPKKDDSPPKKTKTTEILKSELKKGDKILFEDIYFRTNYSFVLPESKKTLKEIAKVLKERDDIYFTILGHVCCTKNSRDALDKKTRKYNLSVARAKYVYDYLVKQGVDKKRMKYKGMRRMFPLGGDPKYDRRVEILITYVENR